MNQPIRMLRRDFVKCSTSIAAGLGISGLLVQSSDADERPTETASSLNIAYLEKGLNALARAHHMSSMAGHLGASLIAGYYVGLAIGFAPRLGGVFVSVVLDLLGIDRLFAAAGSGRGEDCFLMVTHQADQSCQGGGVAVLSDRYLKPAGVVISCLPHSGFFFPLVWLTEWPQVRKPLGNGPRDCYIADKSTTNTGW